MNFSKRGGAKKILGWDKKKGGFSEKRGEHNFSKNEISDYQKYNAPWAANLF